MHQTWICMSPAVWMLSYTICMCIFFPVRLVQPTVSSHAVKTCKFAVMLTRHFFLYSPALGQSPSRRLLTPGPWGHKAWIGCFCKRTDTRICLLNDKSLTLVFSAFCLSLRHSLISSQKLVSSSSILNRICLDAFSLLYLVNSSNC